MSLPMPVATDYLADVHTVKFFRQFYFSNVNNELKVAAANARELVFIRDKSLYVPGIHFSLDFLYSAITDLVT